MPVLSFSEEKNETKPYASIEEYNKENAKFKRSRALFNSKEKKIIRAKKKAEKKAAKAKKKAEKAQDKGEGQFKWWF